MPYKSRLFCGLLLLFFAFNNLLPVYAIDDSKTPRASYPQVEAKAAILMDASSGRVLYQKSAHTQMPPASLTKIMTALLAVEYGHLDSKTSVSEKAATTGERSVWLEAGEKLTRRQLLYACMLNSANDAAAALAESVGGSQTAFATLMNKRAQQLGMNDSHFRNPHGLPVDGHYTSAYDLARLSQKALSNKNFRQVVSTKTYHIPWTGKDYDRLLINQNRLLFRYEGAIGVKTGFTREAGSCVVGAARRGSLELIAVALNSPKVYEDLEQMLDYGFSHYNYKSLKKASQLNLQVPVKNGLAETVKAFPESDLAVAVTSNELQSLTYRLCLNQDVQAPIYKNQVLGNYKILVDGREVGHADLLAASAVYKKPPLLTRLKAGTIKTIAFIFKAFLTLFCLAYLIRLVNIWRRKKQAKRQYRNSKWTHRF